MAHGCRDLPVRDIDHPIHEELIPQLSANGFTQEELELLVEPIKEEMDRRVLVDSGDRVDVVIAELGTWAGAIGAAVHGAEQAARRGHIELPPESREAFA